MGWIKHAVTGTTQVVARATGSTLIGAGRVVTWAAKALHQAKDRMREDPIKLEQALQRTEVQLASQGLQRKEAVAQLQPLQEALRAATTEGRQVDPETLAEALKYARARDRCTARIEELTAHLEELKRCEHHLHAQVLAD